MLVSDTSSEENEDCSLLANAASGDSNALDKLIGNHLDWLLRDIHRKLSQHNPPLSAQDILQHTLRKAFLSFHNCKFDSIRSFRGWLSLLAKRSIADVARWQGRKKRGGDFRQVFANGESEESIVALLEDLGLETPSSIAIREENKREVNVALARLPPDEREVLELYYIEDLSEQKIADEMGLTLGQVSHKRRQASRKLRDILGRSSLFFNKRVPRAR